MRRVLPADPAGGIAVAGVVLLALTIGCARAETGQKLQPAEPATANWDAFAGGNGATNTVNSRAVPVTSVEITGVPYVRSVKLAWSSSERVPTYEIENQTLRLPAETRQAVLEVSIVELPSGADVRVDWYHGDKLVFSDALSENFDGDHYFALVKRDGGTLERLPAGEYRAVVHDGETEIKTVQFQVGG